MKQNIKGKHKVWLYVEFKKEITFSFHFKPSVTRSKIMKENWEELCYDSLWIGTIEVQTSEVAQGCFYEEKELATQPNSKYKAHKITNACQRPIGH